MKFNKIYDLVPRAVRYGHARIDRGIAHVERLKKDASEELAIQADEAIKAAFERKMTIDRIAHNIRSQLRALAALCYDGSIPEPKDDSE